MKKRKKILVGVGLVFLLPILWWFLLGGGVPTVKMWLGIFPKDKSHELRMTNP